jgi:hypothetical protein
LPRSAPSALYNPDHLNVDQAARIADICRTTVGLNPKESPVLGVYLGSPHLDPEVSHYQACVAGLSDSVQAATEGQIAVQADQTCRSKGFDAASAGLAECVLQSLRTMPAASTDQAIQKGAALVSQSDAPPVTQNFFYASPRETRRREELACARLGLEPPYGAFANCVKLLNDNFYAIDNPIS